MLKPWRNATRTGPRCCLTIWRFDKGRPTLNCASMSSTRARLTPLEGAVLAAISEKDFEDRAALNAQAAAATVLSRENTGAGFYTHFTLNEHPLRPLPASASDTGQRREWTGWSTAWGCILWVKKGYIDHLEGYSYDESDTEIDFERVGFEVRQG